MEKYLEEALYDKMMKDKRRVEKIKDFVEESWKDWLEEAKDVHEAFREYGEIRYILKSIEEIVNSDLRDNEDLDMKEEETDIPKWMLRDMKEHYCQRLKVRVEETSELYNRAKDIMQDMCNRIGGDKWWAAFTDCI